MATRELYYMAYCVVPQLYSFRELACITRLYGLLYGALSMCRYLSRVCVLMFIFRPIFVRAFVYLMRMSAYM